MFFILYIYILLKRKYCYYNINDYSSQQFLFVFLSMIMSNLIHNYIYGL